VTSKVAFVYPKGVWFECSGCGLCCGDTPTKTRHILLLQQDAERIATQVNKPISSFARRTSGKGPYSFEVCKDPDTGRCIFLKNNQCTIYAQRPLICRFYPFQLTKDVKEAFVFRETSECPGIRHFRSKVGKRLSEAFFAEMLALARDELGKAVF
jgi:Fe-S-cluster containining protein